MRDDKFQLRDLQQLDDISYDEVDKILEKYEAIRMKLARWINAKGKTAYKDPDTYATIDALLADLPQGREIKKHRAILAQMKQDNCK